MYGTNARERGGRGEGRRRTCRTRRKARRVFPALAPRSRGARNESKFRIAYPLGSAPKSDLSHHLAALPMAEATISECTAQQEEEIQVLEVCLSTCTICASD